MSPASGRYSRVYWEVIDDPKFVEVYDDDAALATWLRLLILADMSWPSSATIPHGVSSRSIAKLEAAKILERTGGLRYRIVGLDAERNRRAASARTGAEVRWHGEREAVAMRTHSEPEATGMLAEQSRAEKSREEQSREDPLDLFFRATGSWPSAKVVPWIEDLASSHGVDRFASALGEELVVDASRHTLLSRTRDRLERDRRGREREAEARRLEAEAAERRKIAEMPEEQRRANLDRLRSMLSEAGLGSNEEPR